jgi:hypothetical protein
MIRAPSPAGPVLTLAVSSASRKAANLAAKVKGELRQPPVVLYIDVPP